MQEKTESSLKFLPPNGPSTQEIELVSKQLNRVQDYLSSPELFATIVDGPSHRATALFWILLNYTRQIADDAVPKDKKLDLIQAIVSLTQNLPPELWVQPWQAIADNESGTLLPATLMLNIFIIFGSLADIRELINQLESVLTDSFIIAWHAQLLQSPEGTNTKLTDYLAVTEKEAICKLLAIFVREPNHVLLIKIFFVLRERISMSTLLADINFDDCEGSTPFRTFLIGWSNNPVNNNLFTTVEHWAQNIPAEAFGTPLRSGGIAGDTLLSVFIDTLPYIGSPRAIVLLTNIIKRTRPHDLGIRITEGPGKGKCPLSSMIQEYIENKEDPGLFVCASIAVEKAPIELFTSQDPLIPPVFDLFIRELNSASFHPGMLDLLELMCTKEGIHFGGHESKFIVALLNAMQRLPQNERLISLVLLVLRHSDRSIWSTRVENTNRTVLQTCSVEQRICLFLYLLDFLEKKGTTTENENWLLAFLAESTPIANWYPQVKILLRNESKKADAQSTRKKPSDTYVHMIVQLFNALERALIQKKSPWSHVLLGCFENIIKRPQCMIWESSIAFGDKIPAHELFRIGLAQLNDPRWFAFLNELIVTAPKRAFPDLPKLWKNTPSSESLRALIDAYQQRAPKPVESNPPKPQKSLAKQQPQPVSSSTPCETKKQPKEQQKKKLSTKGKQPTTIQQNFEIEESIAVPITSTQDGPKLAIEVITPTPPCLDDNIAISRAELCEQLLKMADVTNPLGSAAALEQVSNWVKANKISPDIWLGKDKTDSTDATFVPPIANFIMLLSKEPQEPHQALYQLAHDVFLQIPAFQWLTSCYDPKYKNTRTIFSFLLEIITYRNTVDEDLLYMLQRTIQHCSTEPEVWCHGLFFKAIQVDHPLRMLMVILYNTYSSSLFDVLERIYKTIPVKMWSIGGIGEWKESTPLQILSDARPLNQDRDTAHAFRRTRSLLELVRRHLLEDRLLHMPADTLTQRRPLTWSPRMMHHMPPNAPDKGFVELEKRVEL